MARVHYENMNGERDVDVMTFGVSFGPYIEGRFAPMLGLEMVGGDDQYTGAMSINLIVILGIIFGGA